MLLLLVTFVVLIFLIFFVFNSRRDNYTTGYAVTSGLAFNNRLSYCQPGNEAEGGDFAGGCFLPHRVII